MYLNKIVPQQYYNVHDKSFDTNPLIHKEIKLDNINQIDKIAYQFEGKKKDNLF